MPKYPEMNYCMQCGSKLEKRKHETEGETPFCLNCNTWRYPVFNTAVSMIVMNSDKDKILLIKQYGSNSYILTAGYVNKGEDAEEAVRREIMEELGLKVSEVFFNKSKYYAPSNTLMLNWMCTVENENVNSNYEVDEWKWFDIEDAKNNIRKDSLAEKFLFHYLENI